ncbi:MAG: hypothetical protein M0000_07270 [Actinomycetota bacterium]|nr:hypothetical protein [Actinomycetota bacterium]
MLTHISYRALAILWTPCKKLFLPIQNGEVRFAPGQYHIAEALKANDPIGVVSYDPAIAEKMPNGLPACEPEMMLIGHPGSFLLEWWPRPPRPDPHLWCAIGPAEAKSLKWDMTPATPISLPTCPVCSMMTEFALNHDPILLMPGVWI